MSALARAGEVTYQNAQELRDGLLRIIYILFAERGLTANILPGSEAYVRMEAVARRQSIALANGQINTRRVSPLDMDGQDLLDFCAVFGLLPRPATKATGPIIIGGTGSWTVTEGYVCSATTSTAKFLTTQPYPGVVPGSIVTVEAVTAGDAGNLAEGATVTWDLGTIGAMRKQATVGAGGITGGAPADDQERMRARLIRKLSDPSVGGNAADVREWAEAASAAVLAAYVHSAARGPGSYDVVVVGTGDGVLSGTVCTAIQTYVESHMPGHGSINVTSIVNEGVDIVLAMSLPLPATAGGAGGGWFDSSPWPAEDVQVSAYNSGLDFITVSATVAPATGQSIAIWDPDAETLREYTIDNVGGGGPYTITVFGGFGFDPTDAYVSAGAERLADYFDTFTATLDALGPGEKTDSPDIMPRARRRPAPDVESPSALTSIALDPLTTDHPEVLDVSYSLRVATGTSTPLTSPSLPPTTADATRRLRARYLAIRKV